MNKIPLSASTTLASVDTSAAIVATAYANETGKTGSAAPVLIAVESDATLDAEGFAALLPAAGGQGTQAQARLIVNAVAGVLADLVAEYGAVTVNTPFGTVETFVAGNLENANDAPDPDANVPFLGVVVPEGFRRQFAQIRAYVPTAACPIVAKRLHDKATGKGEIRGTAPFYLEGRNMTYGGAGEKLELLNPLTRAKVCDVAVDATTKSAVKFSCTLPASATVPVGKYAVTLTAKGGTDRLWPVDWSAAVTVPIVPAPTVTSVHDTSPSFQEGKLNTSSGVIVGGTNLANGTLHIKYMGTDSVQHVIDVTTFQSKTATSMMASSDVWSGHNVDTTVAGSVYVTDGSATSSEVTVQFV